MKISVVFSIASILIACLLAGCGDGDDEEGAGPEEEMYLGLASVEPGSWAKHTSSDTSSGMFTWKYFGTDTYSGRQCFVMEFETSSDGAAIVGQVWIDADTGDSSLLVIKQGGKVMKMDVSQTPEVPGISGEEDTTQAQKVGTESYTTPTNKTVEATVYREGSDDQWVSGEVPFGMVKSIDDGKTVVELYDFGFSGAGREISKEEAENAESLSFPGIPGGDIPDDPDVPDNGDVPQQVGAIAIDVGPGARPTIGVSEPIQSLIVLNGFLPVWSFQSPENVGNPQALTFPGPFQYGIAPPNAKQTVGGASPPDLLAGQVYTVQVITVRGALPATGRLTFTR